MAVIEGLFDPQISNFLCAFDKLSAGLQHWLYGPPSGGEATEAPPISIKNAPSISPGDAVVNGVTLPQHVIEALQREGISLAWYTSSELQDAVNACAYDRRLIDDENGIGFRDKLTLDDDEIVVECPTIYPDLALIPLSFRERFVCKHIHPNNDDMGYNYASGSA